jgi:hypothetical protein
LLDRACPHQILVLAENVRGKTLDKVSDFHAKLGITRKSRAVRKGDAWYSLYCFADREHAKLFQAMFGGELLALTQSDPTGSGFLVGLLWWCFWIEPQVPTTLRPGSSTGPKVGRFPLLPHV